MADPYRTNARSDDAMSQNRFIWASPVRIYPPLFTRCPYCHTKTCVHANAVSYYVLTVFIFAIIMLLLRLLVP